MKHRLFFLLALFMIVFSGCNQGGKTGLLIPKDAGLVIHLDLSSLSSKLSMKEIQQTSWYADAQQKADDSLAKKLLADPSGAGLDMDGSLVMFMKTTGKSAYVAVEGKIKNLQQFTSTLEQVGNGKIKLAKDGALQVATMENNEESVLYFNDKMFVFIADASESKAMAGAASNVFSGGSASYPADSLKHFAKTTFSLQGDDLLDSDKRFADLISKKADMHYWVNTGALYGGMLAGPLAMMKFGDLLEGNISLGTADFENGKIVAAGTQLYGKKLKELFSKYSGKPLSTDVLARLPQGDVLAAFAMNYNPEGLKEFLKLLGVDGMANAALGQLGVNISLDDLIKANGSELAAALTGFSIEEKPASVTIDGEFGEKNVVPYTDKKPEFKFVFGVSVNDKPSFQKLIDAIKSLKSSDRSATEDSASHPAHRLQDKWFALGHSDSEVNAFLNGNKKPAYADVFSGHNGGGFVDLQKLILAASANNKDSNTTKALEISAAFWKNINMYWDINGGRAESYVELTLADANTNALKQLNKYTDEMYKATKRNELADEWKLPAANNQE